MARNLDTVTLNQAARDFAGMWTRPDRRSRNGHFYTDGPRRVIQDLYAADFKDEHDYLVGATKEWMGPMSVAEFEVKAAEVFTPRDDKVFADLLKHKLAIDIDGNHIPGAIGTVEIGTRIVGSAPIVKKTKHFGELLLPGNAYWPVYAGELEEREANTGVADPLPSEAEPWPLDVLQAVNPNISAAAAIDMIDALAALFDVGSPNAVINGRTGTQPADPDATESGTLLFTLNMSATAFGAGADAAPGGRITAASITDDSSADATGTLGYNRINDAGGTSILDGSVGTSDADFIYNTLSIVSGAVVSMTSLTITMPQGSTAT